MQERGSLRRGLIEGPVPTTAGCCRWHLRLPLLAVSWYDDGMRSTIDKAGRLVIPKPLRERLGLLPGEVELVADGAALRVEPVARGNLAREQDRLVISGAGTALDDDTVRALRDADRR